MNAGTLPYQTRERNVLNVPTGQSRLNWGRADTGTNPALQPLAMVKTHIVEACVPCLGPNRIELQYLRDRLQQTVSASRMFECADYTDYRKTRLPCSEQPRPSKTSSPQDTQASIATGQACQPARRTAGVETPHTARKGGGLRHFRWLHSAGVETHGRPRQAFRQRQKSTRWGSHQPISKCSHRRELAVKPDATANVAVG